jgi:hypothetical protein
VPLLAVSEARARSVFPKDHTQSKKSRHTGIKALDEAIAMFANDKLLHACVMLAVVMLWR